MLAWKRVCCAVDFSSASLKALREAAALAARIEASLLVVHVLDVVALPGPGALSAAQHVAEERSEAVRQLEGAAALAASIAPGRVRTELLAGDPAWELVKFAEANEVDVLVLGTHGRTGWRRFAVGSITERVLRMAPCPILAIRAPEAEAAAG